MFWSSRGKTRTSLLLPREDSMSTYIFGGRLCSRKLSYSARSRTTRTSKGVYLPSCRSRVPSGVLFLKHSLDLGTLLDDWWWLGDVLSEDVSPDKPRQPHGQLMGDKMLRWDGEDLCGERTSAGGQNGSSEVFNLRSNSSRVSCLVSLTKQKIINQAIRLSPA